MNSTSELYKKKEKKKGREGNGERTVDGNRGNVSLIRKSAALPYQCGFVLYLRVPVAFRHFTHACTRFHV